MIIDLLLATTDTVTNTVNASPIPSWLPDLGTTAAGIAATFALGVDIYTRLFGKHPSIVIYLEAQEIKNNAKFFLVVHNLGDAPAQLDSLSTSPEWQTFSNTPYAEPLELTKSHLLLPTQTLKIPMDTSTIEGVLQQHYNDQTKIKEPYLIQATVSYLPTKRRLLKKPEKKSFSLNLTSVYTSIGPLYNITPSNPFANAIKNHYDGAKQDSIHN